MVDAEITYRVPYADTIRWVLFIMLISSYILNVFAMNYAQYGTSLHNPRADGLMLPVASANCKYKIPAKYDDLLTIKAQISEMKGCRMQVENQVYNQDGQLLVTGGTTHCFVSAETEDL